MINGVATENVNLPRISLARRIFEHVSANPNITRREVNQVLRTNYSDNSISSTLSQQITEGLLKQDADGKITTAVASYRPVRKRHKENYEKRKAAKKEHEATSPEVLTSAQQLLGTLPVTQAFELYKELHKMFGNPK